MRRKLVQTFDRDTFFSKPGNGRMIVEYGKKGLIFSQGDDSDSVFYIQKGQVKVTVVNENGKQAVIAILEAGYFLGEECLIGQRFRTATAVAITDCGLMKIQKQTMIRVLNETPQVAALMMSHLIYRRVRTEEDLIDQLFNSSEKRLARVLLLLSHFGKDGESESVIPKMSQETLAEMIGTTRSRVSSFMNKFRRLGYLEYDHGLRIHSSLQNVVYDD